MPAKSSSTRYGGVIVTIHWVTALLIVVLIGTGFRAAGMEQAAAKAAVLQVHIPVAILTLALTVLRIGWWWLADSKPLSFSMPAWQGLASRIVHFLFYIVILGMAATGIGLIVLSGAGPEIFDGAPSASLDFWEFKPRYMHGIGARFLVLLLILHAGAALFHQFIRRDGLLRRMWY